MRARRALGVLMLAAVALAACADDPAEVDAADQRVIEELDARIPLTMAGLRVEKEDIAETLGASRRPYLRAASLYSIREDDDLLQATLQIGEFAEDVDAEDEDFQSRIIANIGAGAKKVRMGNTELYVTGADRQTLSVWFRGKYLFILSTRDGFEAGRALLRQAVEVDP